MASKKPSLAGEGLGLFTDFLQGVRQGLKHKGGTDRQLESLRDERVIAAIVGLIMAPVHVALEFLDRTISVTMDLSKTMVQLIADGKYDYVNPDIAKHFDFGAGYGIRTTDVHLLHYNKRMTSDQVIADMDHQDLRPVTPLELLWIGIQHSLLQMDFPIVALGAVVRIGGDRFVACLDWYGRGRGRGLYWFGLEWSEDYRFAAVRKSS